MDQDIQQRVDYFLKQLIGPVCLAMAFEVFVQTQSHATALTWVANGALLTYVLVRFHKDSQPHELKWVAAMAGFVVAVIVALAKIFFFKQIWYVFNAFTEPLIVAAVMGLVAYGVATLLKKSTHLMLSMKKGGES